MLQDVHGVKMEAYEGKAKQKDSQKESYKRRFTRVSDSDIKYDKRSLPQKNFEKRLLDFIILDGAPFETVEKEGFRRLIRELDKQITVPSRRTISNCLDQRFIEVSRHG